MTEYKVKILEMENITHDVKKFVVEKPKGFTFLPGQHTHFFLPGFEKKKQFTMTSLPEDNFLEFIIKIYKERNGFTKKLGEFNVGDEITIEDAGGKLTYHGKGLFIAAGTGITPFIAIFRKLRKEKKVEGNKLIYSNKTFDDIILDDELRSLFGENQALFLTRERKEGFHYGRIDEGFLKDKINGFGWFYICGPKEFTLAIRQILSNFGIKHEQVVT